MIAADTSSVVEPRQLGLCKCESLRKNQMHKEPSFVLHMNGQTIPPLCLTRVTRALSLFSLGLFASMLMALPSIARPSRPRCRPLQESAVYRETGRLESLERSPVPNRPDSPIVFALHGLGHHKEGFSHLTKRLPITWRVFAIDAPFIYGKGRAWYRFRCQAASADLDRSVTALMKTVDHLMRSYPSAPKPSVFGFSQGGVMTLSALAHAPKRWSSAASLSGYWLKQSSPSSLSDAPTVLIAHGVQDQIVPIAKGRRAAKLLSEAGALVAWLPFDGEHDIPSRVLNALKTHFSQAWLSRRPR